MKLNNYKIYTGIINWRFFSLYIMIFILFVGLMIRIVYLQLINHDALLREGDTRSLRMQRLHISRGVIRDRMGRLLAISVPVYAVCLNPKEVVKDKSFNILNDQRWQVLSNVLNIPLHYLSSKINCKSDDNFVYLARQISTTIGDYILSLKLPGVDLREESRRYYPCSQIMANVIGVTDIDGHGIEGIEKSFNSILSGFPGKRTIRQDRFGRVIEHISSIKGQSANNLFLSIDERLQTLIFRELHNAVAVHKAESGTAVLVKVDTGEVLAMVSIPSYDPNNLSIAVKRFVRNRAISDLFEPGSTIKPIVIMAALHYGIIQKDSILDTSPYYVNGYQIKDVIRHDQLSIRDILRKSSNVGVSKLALQLPYSMLVDTYLKFGIGKKTNLGLIGESNSLSFCKNYYSDIERATLSYGYGLMVTPLQLAKVYATIGGVGVSRPLSIIRTDTKVIGEQIFPKSLVRDVLNMMDTIPLFSNINNNMNIDMGNSIVIKTGTIKKVGRHGRYINNYVACTAGVAPLSSPKFALVVVIDEPRAGQYYGALVSTPVFVKIMRGVLRILEIQPNSIPVSSIHDISLKTP